MSGVDFKQVLSDAGVPTTETDLIARLRQIAVEEAAPFNNKSEFSPFWRLVKALMVKPLLWLIQLQYLVILPALFLKSATGKWVDVFAWQLGLERKQATKARGMITLVRYDSGRELVVPIGTVIQSDLINNKVYRLAVIKEGLFQSGDAELNVLCEAVETGTAYNLATNFYAVLATPLSGVVQVKNASDWLLVPGADVETDDELKERCRNQFNAVNMFHIDQAYIAMITRWAGVGVKDIYIEHDAPRGPGTANIYILFDHGAPADEYLEQMREYVIAQGNHGFSDDVLIAAIPVRDVNQVARVVLSDRLNTDEKIAIKKKIENFIRVALRDLPNTTYKPTRSFPNARFVWSVLITELHQHFSDTLISIDFESDADIEAQMWIPRLKNLEVITT